MNRAFNYKPTGYNDVSPYFIVEEAHRFLEFVVQVFEGTVLRKYVLPDGSIMHAEIQLRDSVIMVGEASEKFPAIQQLVHVYVNDVDDVFRKAIEFGSTSMGEPVLRPNDPDKRGTFKDFAGNVWSVGTQMTE